MDQTSTDPNAFSWSNIYDGISSVIGTGLVAGTGNAVNNALNTSSPAPAPAAFGSSSGSSSITMVIALAIVGFFVMKALKK